MERLLRDTTAYKIFSADRRAGRLSHAYLLHFSDQKNLRAASLLFAREFFGADAALSRRIEGGSFTDLTVYPEEGGKITVDGVTEIIDDCALKPVEGDKKLYVIVGFENATALVQNKLLKTLEEPLAGIYFLLAASTLAPVLSTVISRVKLLEIPPFSPDDIFAALERRSPDPFNRVAADSCNGSLGAAETMVSGGWFKEVRAAALEICSATELKDVGPLAKKYGDTKYRQELLNEMNSVYFSALTRGSPPAGVLSKHTLIFALEELSRANADLKFNAFFPGLLYDFILKVVKENEKWQKLQG